MEEKKQANIQKESTEDEAPTTKEVRANIIEEVNKLIEWVLTCQTLSFMGFESQLVPKVLELGGLFVQLFLSMRQEKFEE